MSANIVENRVTTLEHRVDMLERNQTEIKQFERALIKRDAIQTTIQVLAMVLAIFGAGGYLSYQNSKVIDQFDKRIDQMERGFNARFDQMEKRFEQMEKRFDDLKEEVRANRSARKVISPADSSRSSASRAALPPEAARKISSLVQPSRLNTDK